tara:strand:- start:986 stop:1948 length:963 start_codon:yes stop_codon:yes gene_type:complete
MRANGVKIICAILIFSTFSSVSYSSFAEEVESLNPGEVILVQTMPIHNGTGNSSNSESPPHLIELYTATWCIPCRTVESEVDELNSWWPALEVVALHPSLESPDELATNTSSEIYNRYQLEGYPTLLVDGHWILIGDEQSEDLQTLLTNLSEQNLPLNGSATLTFDWHLENRNLTLNWSLSSQHEVIIDFLVSGDNVVWPRTSKQLDNVVIGGLTNQSHAGTESVLLEGLSEGNNSITAIVRIAGIPQLEPGSEKPLTSGLSDSWQEPVEVRSISPKSIAIFSILILILAILPMRHTLPVLFRSQTPHQKSLIETKSDDE